MITLTALLENVKAKLNPETLELTVSEDFDILKVSFAVKIDI